MGNHNASRPVLQRTEVIGITALENADHRVAVIDVGCIDALADHTVADGLVLLVDPDTVIADSCSHSYKRSCGGTHLGA
ncbi:hypothetical protein SDC9_192631 [bioreactor metagenome]|uniref:Uncharacterized protein n=1 Tax=bioreactor metagenome TaxID=1076179 RepID=A0A645I9S3_9ZZZZ